MYRVYKFSQAYSQAPWRKQIQWIGIFLLVLILAAMVAGVYLSVSARSVTVGREIQTMYSEMEIAKREIEDLETQLAVLRASSTMKERAEKLGFHTVTADEIFYIVVWGYSRPTQVTLAGPPSRTVPQAFSLADEYSQSLLDWIQERILEPGLALEERRSP